MEPGDTLSDQRRTELLALIDRQSATVGTQIPESVTIHGTELDLREFVVETRDVTVVPPELTQRVRAVREVLTSERKRLKSRLEGEQLTVGEAERIAATIVGIDRAIAALRRLRTPDPDSADRARDLDSHRSWIAFLDEILE